MKQKLLLLFATALFAINQGNYAQCTPGDSLSCPDPEGNGQICPDTFPPAIMNTPFSVEATILPPPSVTYLSAVVPIQRIELISVDNLPPGLTYQSNEPTGVFFPGTYYCVLLSGTPTDTGYFPLKIVVDAYVTLFGNTVYAGQQIDSTSLAITVLPSGATGITMNATQQSPVFYPNPFKSKTNIRIPSDTPKNTELSIFDLNGRLVFKRMLGKQNNDGIEFDGSKLPSGMYFYTLEGIDFRDRGKLIKE